MYEPDILIDSTLLRQATRRCIRTWILFGPLIFVCILAYHYYVSPQIYQSTASLAVQQSSAPSGLAALLGSAGAPNKYIGLLHSRRLAEQVEQRVHVQEFFQLGSHQAALDTLIGSVLPEDNPAEGLLFIHVVLPGPPLWSKNSTERCDKIRKLAADIANAYVLELGEYYANNDNDRDSVLLRAAEDERTYERKNYDQATIAVRQFVSRLKQNSPIGPGGQAMNTGSQLQSLIDEVTRTDADISAEEAAQMTQSRGRATQMENIKILPVDDSFLNAARDRLDRAQYNLKVLLNVQQLSDENPKVVAAREQLRIASADLKNQTEGYRKNLTSERLVSDTRLTSLRAKRDALQASIREAELHIPSQRSEGLALQYLQMDQETALTILRATEAKYAELRLTAVSGKSRLTVVDNAIPADSVGGGISRSVLLGIAASLFPLILGIVFSYFRQARQRAMIAIQLEDEARMLPASRNDVETASAKQN